MRFIASLLFEELATGSHGTEVGREKFHFVIYMGFFVAPTEIEE